MTRVFITSRRRIEPSNNTPNQVGPDGVTSSRGSPILIEATLSETHAKRAQISAHPVEDGLSVTDFIRTGPVGVEIEAAFSNQPLVKPNDNEPDGIFAGDNQTRVSAAWDAFLNLIDGRPRREIFQITTGLKLYDNMALESVGTSQDKDNPEAIIIRARFVEVRIVRSTSTTVPARSLRGGEAQQRGQGDVSQGEQHANDLPVCQACDELCQECVQDNPAFEPEVANDDEPEFLIDEGCVEDANDLSAQLNDSRNADSLAAIQALCPSLSGVQLLDRGTLSIVDSVRIEPVGVNF